MRTCYFSFHFLISPLAGPLLPPACLLIQAGRPEKGSGGHQTPRPASVPLQLDLLQSELAGLAEKRDTKSGKEGRTKKISLPASVSGTKDLSGSTSKKGVERKRSVDSSLGSNLSPTLSPDMKGFFKEKLRSIKPRKGNKVRVEEVGVMRKGLSTGGATGYSHLDCCADVPYNLAEEPEQVDKNLRFHSCNACTMYSVHCTNVQI